ncbi:MAG: BMP family ABC transporter substrate-binding protein [Treponema sp.]|jgi:basic membrane protein A|nr:BMP family ABC transporter substrate-binding protein [Treponema sp.]
MAKYFLLMFFSIISLHMIFSEDLLTVRLITPGEWEITEDIYNEITTKYREYLIANNVDFVIIRVGITDSSISLIENLIDENVDLIVSIGFFFCDAIIEVARKNHGQRFIVIDGYAAINLPNVLEIEFAVHEGSYLVGALAALMAIKNGDNALRFGFLGGVNNEIVNSFNSGYVQGVLSVLPNAELVEYYLNDWADPRRAYTIAEEWYNSDVFAIYCVAGGSYTGVIRQAQEMHLAGKSGWVIGVDSDQFEEGIYDKGKSVVLTSMIKNMIAGIFFGINIVIENDFFGGLKILTLMDNGIDYTITNREISEDIIYKLEIIKEKIKSGEIIVNN